MSAQPKLLSSTSAADAAQALATADSGLAEALAAWRQRLAAAGVACKDIAFSGPDAQWTQRFANAALHTPWTELCTRVVPGSPVALSKSDTTAGADLLVATALQLPGDRTGIVGAALAPPHNERTIQLVLLSLGWLQLGLAAASLAHNQRATRLLEQLGHVASQRGARAAAQEWINRSAAWARAESPELASLTLTLFEVHDGSPRWWVGADTAWAEKASAAVQEATEIASRAAVEVQELSVPGWWAVPLVDDGEPTAVLVARFDGAALPPATAALLRASGGLAEPLLRRWRQAERPLPLHALHVLADGRRKLSGPGHLAWKAAAAGAALLLGVLLLVPVTDRVTANVVIEGRVRQVVTAPFEGFIAQALVRPGERVQRGQPLVRLDDRDLKLEQSKVLGEREQATGKLRQAMAEHDAPALTLAAAELQQAEAQLALVEAKLARATLLAPMDGLVVTGDWVQQIGGPVEAGKEMFEIAATDGYRVVLHVPDRDIARVRAGQPGALRLTGQPQASHPFHVTNVTATASVQDAVNGFRVEAAWDGAAPALSPGMQGVGKIAVGDTNLLTAWTRSSVDWLRMKVWSWW